LKRAWNTGCPSRWLRRGPASTQSIATACCCHHPISLLKTSLVTSGGSRILWGRAPGDDDLEPSVAQKISRLENYIAGHGPLDGAEGRRQIDIRPFDTIEVISLDRPDINRRPN
jgi:hypothetical protein